MRPQRVKIGETVDFGGLRWRDRIALRVRQWWNACDICRATNSCENCTLNGSLCVWVPDKTMWEK